MNIPSMRIAFSMLALAACARAGFAAAEPPAVPLVNAGDIEASLVPDNATVMQGEPLFATLVLKNNSGRALKLAVNSEMHSGQFASAGVREAMRISAVDKAGRKAPAFWWDCGIGAGEFYNVPTRMLAFPAAGKVSLRVCVTAWVVFDRPGSYTVTAAPGLAAVTLRGKGDGEGAINTLDKLDITASGTVEVVPADGAKLGAVIDGLVKKASSGGDDAGAREAAQMLETMSDPRVVPWLRDEAEKGGPKNRVDDKAGAIHALARINDDSAVKALEEVLEATKTDDLRAVICICLLHNHNPGGAAWLRAQGGDENDLVVTYAKASKGISAILAPEKPAILPGEPIYATLTVTNKSDFDVTMMARSDLPSSQGGMERGIKLVAIGKDGTPAPAAPHTKEADEPAAELKSFERSMVIPASGSVQVRLFLPWRMVLEQPGNYTLAVTNDIAFYKIDNAHAEGAQRVNRPVVIPVHASAPLVVQPEDKAKMGALIDSLEKKASAINMQVPGSYSDDSIDAMHRLDWINDERVIPFYKRMMLGDQWGGSIRAMDALAKFNNDDALECLKDGLEVTEIINPASHKPDTQALMQLHIAACDDLVRSPHPGAMAYLLTQRKNPDLQVRIKVMEAVAVKLPPKDAIPILEEMQHDPQAWVGQYATRYLNELKAGKKVATEFNENMGGVD